MNANALTRNKFVCSNIDVVTEFCLKLIANLTFN